MSATTQAQHDKSVALLSLLSHEEAVSLAKACKRLGLSMSELLRLLVELGPASSLGGLELVERVHDGRRECLRLTPKGRALCSQT